MNTRWRWIVTVVLAGVTVGGSAAAATAPRLSDLGPATDDAFVIDGFVGEVVVEADGRLEVVEAIDVTFHEARRGIVRDLDRDGPADVVDYTVHGVDRGSDGEPWTWTLEEAGADTLAVRIGDADMVLDPGPQHYRLRYTLDGLLFHPRARPDVVQVRIDVPGIDWATSVAGTRLVVDLPAEPTRVQCVQGRAGEVGACPTAEVDGTRVVQAVPDLAPFRTATVLIEVPAEAFTGSFPVHAVEELDTPGADAVDEREPPLPAVPAGLLLLGLVAAPALALEAARGRLVYRDRVTDPALHDRVAPTAELAPPDDARPTELAAVLQRSVGNEVVLATLLDLELRGHVRTTTEDAGGKRQRIHVVATPDSDGRGRPLRPWEAAYLDGLLGGEGRITFDGEFDEPTAKRATAARRALTTHASWLLGPDSPLTHRGAGWLRGGAYAGWIVLSLLLGAAIGVGATWWLRLSVVTPIVVWVMLGVTWIVLSLVWRAHRLPLTSEGRDVIARTRAFRRFLEEVHGDRLEFAGASDRYDHRHPAIALLPYAMALGLADSWYARFEPVLSELARQGAVPGSGAEPWWAYGAGYAGVRRSYASTTTAPSSSSGGGSFGGGGAGSGGGGGGGRSW